MKNNWFITKLNSRTGESLPEVLIAVLVVALGLVMLGTLLNVSSRMVDKSQAKVVAVYEDVSEMDGGQASGDASVESSDSTVSIKYKLNGTGAAETTKGVDVTFYRGKNLISYEPKVQQP